MSKLTIPDWLSISRIVMVPVVLLLAYFDLRMWCASLLLTGFITDALDGYLARKWNITTARGSRLDSTGDALLFVAGVAAVFWFEWSFVKEHWLELAIALGLYFVQLGLAYWRYGKPSSFHTYSAKTAAVLQAVFLVCTLYFGPRDWLFYVALAISILETVEEIILIFIYDEWVNNIKGLYWVMRDDLEAKRN
ncbi:CDP-alcohol phosphatidyltransferase family protein [Cesiribacter sp. SM1]|uniref:CDP-alcohol phosphatidyltransferase family protein n=1 Tax=Cesiribacter sp. SM1 TaxID=2861196 RepID=UPI001CD70F8C|nr:CDP-alcohol phosphatidyltransferase family protein [Cesiribacter sp. SM1]